MDDEELDNVVRNIKNEMPTTGYRMVKGRLRSMGIHIQWRRVAASLHRVDSMGILSRLSGLGCILQRTYSVRAPLSLWHVDTNHKLIRLILVTLPYLLHTCFSIYNTCNCKRVPNLNNTLVLLKPILGCCYL